MPETLETLAAKITAVGDSVDQLRASVDQRFEQVDKRLAQVDKRFEQVDKRFDEGFAAVDEHFAEQRAYTEFAYARLEKTMNVRFDRLERKFDRLLIVRSKPRRR